MNLISKGSTISEVQQPLQALATPPATGDAPVGLTGGVRTWTQSRRQMSPRNLSLLQESSSEGMKVTLGCYFQTHASWWLLLLYLFISFCWIIDLENTSEVTGTLSSGGKSQIVCPDVFCCLLSVPYGTFKWNVRGHLRFPNEAFLLRQVSSPLLILKLMETLEA